RGAAERAEVVEQHLGSLPALGERLAQLLHANGEGDRVAGPAEALSAELALRPNKQERRNLLGPALKVTADIGGQVAGDAYTHRNCRPLAVEGLPVRSVRNQRK